MGRDEVNYNHAVLTERLEILGRVRPDIKGSTDTKRESRKKPEWGMNAMNLIIKLKILYENFSNKTHIYKCQIRCYMWASKSTERVLSMPGEIQREALLSLKYSVLNPQGTNQTILGLQIKIK